jgi:hypothetical protein
VNFYEIGGFLVDPDNPDPFNIYNSPSWRPLIELAETRTDLIRMVRPIIKPASKNLRDEFFETENYEQSGSKFTKTTIKIAGKELKSLRRRDKEVDTTWTLEHFLKNPADLEAYLQLPDEIFEEDVDISNLLSVESKVADRGIVMVDTEDPVCNAASLFSMEDFTIIALTEQKLFHQLLEKLFKPLITRTEKIARQFPGRLWRIYGPEYATEPYLPPKLFEDYVVRYTSPMVKIIKEHGGFARIHSHGKIKNVLDHIVKMGADATDPIEPPPQGDVELEYVRSKYGRQLVLFGNLEISDIENCEPAEFEKIVKKSIEQGTSKTGRGFVLMPSASPYGREISAKTMANYETMVRLTEQY